MQQIERTMGNFKKYDSRWNWKKFIVFGLISITVGVVSSLLISGQLHTDIHSLLANASYSLMLGYGLFANGYVTAFAGKYWISWRVRPVKSLLISLAVTLVYSSFVILFTNWFWYTVMHGMPFKDFLIKGRILILIEYIALFLITQFFYARAFFKEWRQAILEEEKLKQEAIALQYKVLSNQVNPHFLFNSLNVLSSLIRIDGERAVSFVDKLSLFYRDLLAFRGKDVVDLAEELHFVSQYMELQKERFGDHIQMDISGVDHVGYMLIPMTIQMLVENAIKHNQVRKDFPLKIDIYVKDDFVVVSNNLQPYHHPADGTRLGLKNLAERYSYLAERDMEIIKTGDRFLVKVPLLKFEDKKATS
jgi:sensor histidine kinase YesM